MRLSALVANLLAPADRRTLALALDMSNGRVEAWATETCADVATLPAFAIVHMPTGARGELLRALAEWGDLNDRGEL